MNLSTNTKQYVWLNEFNKTLADNGIESLSELKREMFDDDGFICEESKLLMVDNQFQEPKTTILNRISLITLTPIFFFIVMPVKWAVTGNFYLNKSNKYSRLILNLVGEK